MKRMPLELLNFDWDLVKTKFINDFPYSPAYQVEISDLHRPFNGDYTFTVEIQNKSKKLTVNKRFRFSKKDFYSSEFSFVEIFETAIITKVYELFTEMNLK